MPQIHPAFSPQEYFRRIALVRAEMVRKGLDALFVADPSNMAWLTGYDGWSFYVPQGVLLSHTADPLWWGRMQDAAGALRTVWMTRDRIRGYPDDFVQSADRHAMEDLADHLLDTGYGTARLGVELDNYYYSARAHIVLGSALPNAALVDATGLVNRKRAIKSEPEIAFMRKAARISETLIDGVLDRIRPGLPKNEMVAEIYADAVRGIDGIWGDYPAIVPLLPSGTDAAAPHLTWDGRPFVLGEATFFELSGCYRRYHAPFCRTVFLGTPPPELRNGESALIDALAAGIDAARPGNRAADVATAVRRALDARGIKRSARCGYPVGLSYPPDWGERTLSFRESDQSVLEPGMTFHFMPGLWMDNWGLEITETILIRDSGPAECLCDRPRKLFVRN